jgi:hypothetical protein
MSPESFSLFSTWSRTDQVGEARGRVSIRGDQAGPSEAEYRERYEAYCTWQAQLLPTLVPREAIRPMYRAAHEWALERGLETGKDPLALLRRYCRAILPLPPFEVWVERFRAAPEAFLEIPARSGELAGAANVASIVAVRGLEHGGGVWTAALNVQQAESGWRGFIGFTGSRGNTVRTAEIFLEPSLDGLRDRFWTLEPDTLSAFLRSALP